MRQSGWMGKAKALAVTTAFVCVAIAASTAAQADYSYTFSIVPSTGSVGPAFGSFTTDNMINATSSAFITSANFNYTINSNIYSGSSTGQNQFAPNFNPGFLSTTFNGGNATLVVDANLNYKPLGFSGTAKVTEFVGSGSNAMQYSGSGIFQALFTSSGGGGGSGGAPAPEVNAGIGILIASASFAFLRRKRGTRHEATAL